MNHAQIEELSIDDHLNLCYNNDKTKKNIPRESKGEKKCRIFLEEFFGKPFPKVRPDFLSNPVTGGEYNLELDCYNKELKLCVEYNGRQHYEYTPFFHKNKEAFYNQKYRDEMKRMKCRSLDINMIEVPYYIKDIDTYLTEELSKLGYFKKSI
jgi:hypothetical protein